MMYGIPPMPGMANMMHAGANVFDNNNLDNDPLRGYNLNHNLGSLGGSISGNNIIINDSIQRIEQQVNRVAMARAAKEAAALSGSLGSCSQE